MDLVARRVVERFVSAANIRRLDLAWVEGLRKDFLTLLKNLPKVKDYKTAHVLRDAFRVYRTNFDDLFFKQFMNEDLKYNLGLSESDIAWLNKTLRSIAWSFSIELTVPIGFADEYNTEEGLFARFEREFPTWKTRLQRKAQAFWKEMRETIEWFENIRQKPIDVRVPTVEKMVLEGFQVTVQGYEPGDEGHEEKLAILKEGLGFYRSRAAKVAPILLQKQLPLVCEFKALLDKGGEYNHAGYITFFLSSVSNSKGKLWVAHALAHEMGHHLFRTYLSQGARDFWYQTIRGDFGDIDLKGLLDKWPGTSWAFEFTDVMGQSDPILALQVDAVSHDTSYGDLQKKEDFQKLYDSGQKTLRVPQHPVTGYGNKNPEEAFCEAIGLLVAYGPRAVHERVQWWLNTVLPGKFKVARTEPARSR